MEKQEKVWREELFETQDKLIDKILTSAESNRLTPSGFITDAQKLLEVSGGSKEVKNYLQTVMSVTKTTIQVNSTLVDLLQESCLQGQLDDANRHYQTFQALGLDQKPEVQQFLSTVKSIFPNIETPPKADLPQIPQTHEQSRISKAAETPSPYFGYKKVSRRAFIITGVGAAMAGLAGWKITSDTVQARTALAQKEVHVSTPQAPVEDFAPPTSSQLVSKEAAPMAEILPPPNPHLGIRNDIVEIMEWVPRLGTNSIRIDGGMSETMAGNLKDYKVRRLLSKAKEMNLNVLYVFNPQWLLTPEETVRRLEAILTSGAKVTLELGNEPDVEVIDRNGTSIDYWRGNMASFAQFVATSLQTINKLEASEKISAGTKVVAATPLKEENLKVVIQQLKNRGLDPSTLTFAVHAYHTPEEVKRAAGMIQKNTGGKLMFTEIGVDSVGDSSKEKNVDNLIEMYKTARGFTEEPIFIHELPFNQPDPVTGEGFGFIGLDGGKATPLPGFEILKQGVSKAEKNFQTKKAAASFP